MSYDVQINDGDIVVDHQGDTIVVQGYDKLQQDLNRLMYIARGDNKFDTDEGCGIIELLGKSIPRDLTEMLLNKDLYLGLNHLIDQQRNQSLVQSLSGAEQIMSVDAIAITQLDLKSISFQIAITTVQGSQEIFVANVK
jgi:hypothetical protein